MTKTATQFDSRRSENSEPLPAGIYVPVPTFFTQQSGSASSLSTVSLDLTAQTQHSLFLVNRGIKGLVILGTTGEAVSVTLTERKRLLASQRKALDAEGFQDTPIIAGTTAQSVADTLEQIKHSKDAGAQYALVLAPGYFASLATQAGLNAWYEAVADQSDLPILIYHYPAVTNGLHIAPSTFENLASHPNIVGAKLSHGIVDDITLIGSSPHIDHDRFHLFTGLGQCLLPFMAVGGVGAIDAVAGCFPRVIVRLYKLYNDSLARGITQVDLLEMRELQFRICQIEKLSATWGVVGIKEVIGRLWGIGEKGTARLPITGAFEHGESEWIKWEEIVQALRLLEEGL
ncbi:aldolase, partial [Aureobasidium melanogenum]